MTFEERAHLIWDSIKDNLSDRGLFNGIDEETESDIDRVQIEIIVNKLGNQ